MRSLVKRFVMWLYFHRFISFEMTNRIVIKLKEA